MADLHEWLNLLVRMAHFIAGIMWVGTSFYFVWWDSAFTQPAEKQDGVRARSTWSTADSFTAWKRAASVCSPKRWKTSSS